MRRAGRSCTFASPPAQTTPARSLVPVSCSVGERAGMPRNSVTGRRGTQRGGPLAIADGRTFTVLAAGANTNYARALDGASYCWGSNFFGAIGNGSQSDTGGTTRRPSAVARSRSPQLVAATAVSMRRSFCIAGETASAVRLSAEHAWRAEAGA